MFKFGERQRLVKHSTKIYVAGQKKILYFETNTIPGRKKNQNNLLTASLGFKMASL